MCLKKLMMTLSMLAIVPLCRNDIAVGQQKALPAPLILTAASRRLDHTMRLVWVDDQTGNLRDFYVDTEAQPVGLRSLAWSPDGRYLLIARLTSMNGNDQLCVLTRAGILSYCSEDILANTSNIRRDDDSRPYVSWAEDSASFFYMRIQEGSISITQRGTEGNFIADVLSFSKEQSNIDSRIAWNTDLSVIVQALSKSTSTPTQKFGPSIVNRGESRSVTFIQPSQTDTNFGQYFCSRISPLSYYITALAVTGDLSSNNMFIYEKDGKLGHTVLGKRSSTLFSLSCPVWSPDESSIYFWSLDAQPNAALYRYDLKTTSLQAIYKVNNDQLNPQEVEVPPLFERQLTISPDGSALAAVDTFAPTGPGNTDVNVILFREGIVKTFLGDYEYTMLPLWVPPER